MSESALDVLQRVFGYESFRGQQSAVIERTIEGQDSLVLMPTGGGKSLCYQIPSIVRSGTGLVVSPLIALMQDQVAALRQAGVSAAALNSSMPPAEAAAVERTLLEGELDLLYMAPERLMTERTLALLERAPLALLAIDEAHCVSQWGHDFRPEYLALSSLAQRFPQLPRIALTATADEATRREIITRLSLEGAQVYIGGFDRPNIAYAVHPKNNAKQQLLRFLRETHRGDAGIVYCLSRRKVEGTAEWLCAQGFDALPYHAGLEDRVRADNQTRFLREDGVVIVATIAFGMGIDKPDVRFVAHLDLPKSIEAYYQETGRAGRDGEPADAWMSYGLQDVILLRQMVEGSDANEERKRVEMRKLDALLGYCEVTSCRRQVLLEYFGESMHGPCGNCDTCVSPPALFDATQAARMALSCVFRTGQRFGAGHLIDVLMGKDNERIRRLRHDKLSVHGVGKAYDLSAWRAVFRQLVARRLLSVDRDGYGTFALTERSRPVLRGEESVFLRRDIVSARPGRVTRDTSDEVEETTLDNDGLALFERLRQWRLALAKQQGVPPYVIFHDGTLRAVASLEPRTLSALAQISGVGQKKLERYGSMILAAVEQHQGLLDESVAE